MKWIMRWCLLLAASHAFSQGGTVDLGSDVSEMTCRVVHPFRSISMVSREVMYRVRADTSTRSIVEIEALVDLNSFVSEDAGWNMRARAAVDTAAYPVASFESVGVSGEGESVRITGDLILHGVKNPMIIQVRPVWSSEVLSVSGAFDLSLSAHGITRPSILLVPVADTLRASFRARFRLK